MGAVLGVPKPLRNAALRSASRGASASAFRVAKFVVMRAAELAARFADERGRETRRGVEVAGVGVSKCRARHTPQTAVLRRSTPPLSTLRFVGVPSGHLQNALDGDLVAQDVAPRRA